MVREYLNKMRDEFLEKKVDLVKEIHTCENELKENIQFIQVLENTNDPNYEAFTPREVNGFNRKKIVELQEEQQALTSQTEELQRQLQELDFKIEEITNVIKSVGENAPESDDISEDGNIDADLRMTLLQTVEKDRQRIARDLHDTTTQNLTSLVHKTELCTKIIDTDPIRCKLELYSIEKTLREVIEDTRKLIYDLRPMSLDDIGFDVTVERSLDKFNQLNNIKSNYHVVGEPYTIDSVIQITLLRVIQEACNNSVKYSSATRLDITVIYEESQITVKIEDDGKGFDLQSVSDSSRNDNSGFGLSMMRERVYQLSGKIDIQSSPGNGCQITVTIPV